MLYVSDLRPSLPVKMATDEFTTAGIPQGWPGRIISEIFALNHVEVIWFKQDFNPINMWGWDFTGGSCDTFIPITEEEYAARVATVSAGGALHA